MRGAARHAAWRFAPPEGLSADDFIYGETPLVTARQILQWAEFPHGGRFVEVGCGRAVVSLVARLVYQAEVSAFEAVPELADKARWLDRALEAGLRIITSAHGPYPAAELYYLTATTWGQANLKSVAEGLEAAPSGSRAIVLTQPLPDWPVLEERLLPFSWGWCRTYLQQR